MLPAKCCRSRAAQRVPARRFATQRGSASLEFLTVGLVLLLPLIYLTFVVARVQAGALAVEGAARQAVRIYLQHDTQAVAETAISRAVDISLADFGVSPSQRSITVSCLPAGVNCFHPGMIVTVRIDAQVSLPFLPDLPGLKQLASVPLSALASGPVSRFVGSSQ